MNIAPKVAAAETKPTCPTWSANTVSFYWRGVSSSACWIFILSLPYDEFFPTAATSMVPVPYMSLDPEIMKQLAFSCLV